MVTSHWYLQYGTWNIFLVWNSTRQLKLQIIKYVQAANHKKMFEKKSWTKQIGLFKALKCCHQKSETDGTFVILAVQHCRKCLKVPFCLYNFIGLHYIVTRLPHRPTHEKRMPLFGTRWYPSKMRFMPGRWVGR